MLLLDEPTNHLDAESVAWLERHLHDYKGTVVAVTHDRYFLDNSCEWILELDQGRGIPCKGNYTRGKLVFPYDASRACTSTEQYSWVTYAEDWARQNGYFDLYNWDKVTQRRIIMIIPSATKCAWAGLSPVGCYKSCATYIKGKKRISNVQVVGYSNEVR